MESSTESHAKGAKDAKEDYDGSVAAVTSNTSYPKSDTESLQLCVCFQVGERLRDRAMVRAAFKNAVVCAGAWVLDGMDCLVVAWTHLAGLSRWNEPRNLALSGGSGSLVGERTATE